ncbi:MAG: group II intron reverse transcriptase/maturase [Cyclobacteriaceae bacterium]|nr:group II intron reverse transcriptase/maturase [Cyclobacteriaceae bacterium]
MRSTRDKGEMLTVEMQIAERSRKYTGEALTNLHQYIDVEFLHECFQMLNKQSASGVDGERWRDYDRQRAERIPKLLAAFKSGTYQAPNIRRVYIPKGDGKQQRPLGLPTIEDKILQTAVNRVLSPIYEQEFYASSYGFRPGKSQHQALEELFKEASFKGKRYIIDADMKDYFGTISHQWLRTFLDERIKDGVIRKMMDKWLKAGILEEGQVTYPKDGTPQGGTISPLLSNIYLHYVLEMWFKEQIQPLLKGGSFVIRYADDFLMGFSNKEDALRVMKVLPKRLAKYGLTLNPEKTRLVNLDEDQEGEEKTFDFLGFTHYMGNSLKGKRILKRKTSKKKLRISLIRMNNWMRDNRHRSVAEIVKDLNRKLRGYYEYYGITFNSRQINAYYDRVVKLLQKWLNRRGGKKRMSWDKYLLLVEKWVPLLKPKIYHSSLLAKPKTEEPYAGKPLVRVCGGAV